MANHFALYSIIVFVLCSKLYIYYLKNSFKYKVFKNKEHKRLKVSKIMIICLIISFYNYYYTLFVLFFINNSLLTCLI